MGIIYNWGPNSNSGGGGSGSGVQTYPTFADFPASAPDGTLGLALDTDTLYAFNANSMMWVPIGAPISAAYTVNTFTLTPTDISNGYVTLTSTPTAATSTVLSVIGGPVQSYGDDFIVSGDQLTWTGFFLDGILISGDKLVVQFL